MLLLSSSRNSLEILSSDYILISLSTNIRDKCVTRIINLYFFGRHENRQIFPSKVCYFQYVNRFLSTREMGNIRSCKEVRLQKLIKFRLWGYYSFWNFSSCLKLKNHLGRVSPSHFRRIFWQKLHIFLLKTF